MNPTPDSTSNDPQQLIAELQRLLAERTVERDEALERETATAEVLQVINSSPGNLAPVFDALLEKAMRLCGAAHGHMVAYYDGVFHRAAIRGDPSFVEFWTERISIPAPKDTPLARIAGGERIVHLRDAMADAGYRNTAPYRQLINVGGIHTLLAIALRKEDALLGAILVYRKEVQLFTDKQIALLQNFAAQAVIAMENARLITETGEALEQQTATSEILQVINSSPGDLVPVFDAMLEKARVLCGFAHGTFNTYDGEYFRSVAFHGIPEPFAEVLRQPRRTGSNFERLLHGEPVVHIADITVRETSSDDPVNRAAVDAGIRTVLFVPLRKDRTLLGYITANRREVRPFTDKQIALLQNFAAQAVIAMENARLITETREALEQQTATAEVLQVINSSPGDLAPVFDAMLKKATHLCDAAFGIMSIFDGERFHPAAVHNVPEAYTEFMRHEPPQPSPKSALGRIRDGERVVQIEDYARDQDYEGDDPRRRALVELGGARSYVAVGLYKDDNLLGTLAAYRQELRPFSEREIALLQNFAAQAVIAMENARLITETREALDQQTATAEVLQVINSSPGDLAPVFDAMLSKATRLCEAQLGILWTFEGDFAKAGALHQVPEAYARLVREPFRPSPESGPARMIRGENTFTVANLLAFPPYEAGDILVKAIVDLAGARSVVITPLRKDGSTLGAITIYRQEVGPFSQKHITLLENFAAQAVIAIENARLINETREALDQQTATAEVLQVINSSPGDLTPVFDAILEKAHTLCDAATGSLRVIDGDMIRAVAFRGQSGEFADRVQQGYLLDNAPLLAPLRDGAPFVHISDVAERDDSISRLSTANGNRTILAVPLRKDDALFGMIVAGRKEVRPFTDKQIALLQNFAAQAVIAMENARLITETREALDQQTATAEVLQVINSSPGDLAPVFDAMLEKARSLCGAVHGALVVYDGEHFRAVATHGLPEPLEGLLRTPFRPNAVHQALLRGERLIHIADQAAVETDTSIGRASVDAGARTLLLVPLRKDGALLGYITASHWEVRPFSDKEIALLENFAAQAVIAIENARLITETREALEQQTATAEVLQVINASPGELAPVFDAILHKAVVLCEAAFGVLLTYEAEQFHAVALHNVPQQFAELMREPFRSRGAESATGRLVQGENVVLFADIAAHPAYAPETPNHRFVLSSGARSHLAVALRKDGVLHGAVIIYRTEVRPFTDKQIALLQNFAAQAVIAMENARLLGELRQRTDEVAELNRGLEARVAEQVDELGRVGRLKRFLAPQLAELIVSQGDEKILESHRREIVVVFCDLRGYTAFTETAEPEEVLDFLREYHGALGPLVSQFEGTLDQFSGDGIMVFFNDPVPCADPAERAVKMAVAMRTAANTLIADWRERGRDLGFGAGIAQGYATLGQIGFSERSGYTAIGTVCNVAARLCAEAKDGQILLGQRVNVALKGSLATEQLGPLTLKGLTQPVVAYNVPLGAIQPALRVIEGGSPETV